MGRWHNIVFLSVSFGLERRKLYNLIRTRLACQLIAKAKLTNSGMNRAVIIRIAHCQPGIIYYAILQPHWRRWSARSALPRSCALHQHRYVWQRNCPVRRKAAHLVPSTRMRNSANVLSCWHRMAQMPFALRRADDRRQRLANVWAFSLASKIVVIRTQTQQKMTKAAKRLRSKSSQFWSPIP